MSSLFNSLLFIVMILVSYLILSRGGKYIARPWWKEEYDKIFKPVDRGILSCITVFGILFIIWSYPSNNIQDQSSTDMPPAKIDYNLINQEPTIIDPEQDKKDRREAERAETRAAVNRVSETK